MPASPTARPTSRPGWQILAPVWGVVALVVGIGIIESLRPDLTDPGDLRRIYAGPAADWPVPWVDAGVDYAELAPAMLPVRAVAGSPEAARVALGERLFNDPALSASGQIACQSCHNRHLGWGDGLPRAFGHGRAEGRRNAMPLFASARRPLLFWDGRATSLSEQITGPLTAANEMANPDAAGVPARLAALPDYPEAFRAAFGSDGITYDRMAAAIAAYESGLDRPTRLDRFLSGDTGALDDRQVLGLHLFRTKARCANCHSGPDLTDGKAHNLGLAFLGRPLEDLGRYGVTGQVEDAGRFVTPSLRHVATTGPWMHNGIFPTLEGVVNFYAGGGGRSASAPADPLSRAATTVSPHLRPLTLSPDERAALVAFLEAL